MSKVGEHRYTRSRVRFDELEGSLGTHWRVRRGSKRITTRTYLDSFDWRLHARGEALVEEVDSSRRLDWQELRTGTSSGSLEGVGGPRFASELPPGPFRQRLEQVLEMRALLPQARLRCRLRPSDLLDEAGKVVARVRTESTEVLGAAGPERRLGDWIVAIPVRGYDKPFRRLCRLLEDELGLVPDQSGDMLSRALAAEGRRPGAYSSQLDFRLDPEQLAAASFAEIFRVLTDTLEANLEGTIADWDSEFLHDLRVSVRRIRSGLKQLAALQPSPDLEHFREHFARLGAATSLARDIDVHLLDFPSYRAALPVETRADLEPLHSLLCARKESTHGSLVAELESDWLARLLSEWRVFLSRLAESSGEAGDALARPVLAVASERIWKVYRRVWREGRAIGPATEVAVLHELRKRCKELRYLMEFFRSLYPRPKVAVLIKELKALQETLGTFQDLQVQTIWLGHVSHELAEEEKVGPEVLLAVGALIERLETQRTTVRAEFHDRFARYASEENRATAAKLFKANLAHPATVQ